MQACKFQGSPDEAKGEPKGAAKEPQGSPKGVPLEPEGSPNGDLGESWRYKIQGILTIPKRNENERHPGFNAPSKPPLMEPTAAPRSAKELQGGPKGVPLEPKGAPTEMWESPRGIKIQGILAIPKTKLQ